MVRKVAENGAVYHEPPYTWEEEQDFYRRIAGGPVRVLHAPAIEKPTTKPRKSPQRPREE